MSKVRFRYSKTGKAKYISHLDLMATMQRGFLRGGVNLKYSEGFNPHPYLSVALPLSVGYESLCELIDVGIADETIPDLRSIVLPEGIELTEVYNAARKFSEIAWVKISAKLHYDRGLKDDDVEKIRQCFMKESIFITKRTKRGFKELDIAPYIKDVDPDYDGSVLLRAKISAQNPALNISDLESALDDELKPDYSDMKRIDIYDSNMVSFN